MFEARSISKALKAEASATPCSLRLAQMDEAPVHQAHARLVAAGLRVTRSEFLRALVHEGLEVVTRRLDRQGVPDAI